MPLIDAHAHLSFFNSDQLDSIFKSAADRGIEAWIMAGYDLEDWAKQKQIAQKFRTTKMSFGLHPWRVLDSQPEEIEFALKELERLLPQAQACGETGIDGFRTEEARLLQLQEDVFLRHLEINRPLDLPLVLHIVKSHERCLKILKRHSFRGIVHGFSGSWETAKNYVSLGYKISIGRGIYQKGFKNLKETALKIDLSDLVIESDAYVDEEGRPEDPVAILCQVAQSLAEIKGVPVEKIGRASCENVKAVFG